MKKPDRKGSTLCPSICVIVEKIPHHRSKEQWLLGDKSGARLSGRAVTLHWSHQGAPDGKHRSEWQLFPRSAVYSVCREAVQGHIRSETSHLFHLAANLNKRPWEEGHSHAHREQWHYVWSPKARNGLCVPQQQMDRQHVVCPCNETSVRDKKEDGDACYTMLTPENVLGGRGSPLRSISDSMPAGPE